MEEELRLNGLAHKIMDKKRQAGQILVEMQNESLKQIVIGIWDGSRGKEWYDISLAELKKKIKCHLELLGSTGSSYSTPTKPKNKTSNNTQLSLQETTPNGEFQYLSTVIAMEKQIIKAMKIDKRPSTLLDLAGKYPGTCCIHPNKSHHSFKCLSLKRICRDNNWSKSLYQVIKMHEKVNGKHPQHTTTIGSYKFSEMVRKKGNRITSAIKYPKPLKQPQHQQSKCQPLRVL